MLQDEIAVSVCILVYNHKNYLDRAISSFLSQKTNFKFEIIIGDDCSPDNSREIIEKYAQKYDCIVPIIRKKNIGATRNQLDLLAQCKGKYFCFMDGDDFLVDDNKLQRQYDWLESHPDMYSVAARGIVCDENEKVLSYEHFSEPEVLTPDNYRRLKCMPHIATFMFRNIFFDEKELKRFSDIILQHSIIGDWTEMLYFLDKSDITVFPDKVHCYRFVVSSNASNFSSLYRLKKNKYDVITERMKYEQCLNNFEFKRVCCNYSVAGKGYQIINTILLDHNKESRKYGKHIFETEFKPKMSKAELRRIPIGLFRIYRSYAKIFINKVKEKLETKSEIGKSI